MAGGSIAIGGVMVPHLRQTESETVFHYTGGEGLLGIVSRGEIWASSYTVLNDLSEVKYGIDVVEQEVARRGEHIPAEFKDDFKNARSLILAHDLYLISASREGDLLNQWQGYAGLQGYAIEIEVDPSLDVLVPREAAHMLATSPTPLVPSSWYDVIYDPATQQRMTAETIEALIQILQRLDQPIPLQSKIIGAILAALVVRFKHPAFAAEQEVRFILSRHDAAIEEYRTSGNGTLIPYLRMAHAPMVPPGEESTYGRNAPFYNIEENKRRFPIRGVVVGPSSDSVSSVKVASVEKFLLRAGHKVPVKVSGVPYSR